MLIHPFAQGVFIHLNIAKVAEREQLIGLFLLMRPCYWSDSVYFDQVSRKAFQDIEAQST